MPPVSERGASRTGMSAEQTEQVRLLGKLVKADGTAAQVKQDVVLQRCPDWHTLERAGVVPPDTAADLRDFHSQTIERQSEILAAKPELVVALVSALSLETEIHPAQYALTVLYEVVRENSSRYEAICGALVGFDVYNRFIQVLRRPDCDAYTADRAAFMLSGLMCRARTHTFSEEQVSYFVECLMRTPKIFAVSEVGRLDALVNILKIDLWRRLVWETRGVPQTLLNSLSTSQPGGVLYKATFCLWVISFNSEFVPKLTEEGLVKKVCEIVKESRVEKVVRVCLQIVKNLLNCEAAVEIIIEENVAQIMALLEFEKWRDPDMYEEIRSCIFSLEAHIRKYNNFDRYCAELEKQRFKWSVLHSEKFWRENVMCFENDEFAAVQKIVALLDSDDPTTQAIACHDLGEFARLHPAGKKICQRMLVKDRVMLMISNKNREVAGEALLCVQKLMLNNWQDVAKPQK